MSTVNDTNPVDMDDLDAFENAFFNKESKAEAKDAPQEDSSEDEVDEIEEDALATEGDEDSEDDVEEEDEDPEPEPKPKGKKSAKDRIEELVAKTREAERRETALLKRLEQLESRKEVEPETKLAVKLREALSADAPNPDADDEEGNPLYPLGEFDPMFIRDLTRYTIKVETAAVRAKDAETEQHNLATAAQEELRVSWVAKVDEAEKEFPDLREKLGEMSVAFESVDPNYGEYLAATIMSCDAGPQIMYYLSQNIGEAQKIVASGPAAATLAIGRLEARLTPTKTEPKRNSIKQVTKAPVPPETRTRGNGSKFSVNADTDDLDAFEREFFKKK